MISTFELKRGKPSSEITRALIESIQELAAHLPHPIQLMEVCGSHTMAIRHEGIQAVLPENIHLTSGPGCPVCVTPITYVDKAVALARLPGVIITTFGDMLRVPGSSSSLSNEKALGADVRIVYSPLDAVDIAKGNPDKKVVFLGVGFETTAPLVGSTIVSAKAKNVDNFYVLSAHKTIPVPMAILTDDPDLKIDGYICPGHVATIIGNDPFEQLAKEKNLPCVVTGFDALDILQGIEMLVRQIVEGQGFGENQYSHAVAPKGNLVAQDILKRVFEPCDSDWRGIGVIPGTGLKIREEFRMHDAESQIYFETEEANEPAGCICGEILKGKSNPKDCSLFDTTCTPENPIGACMVSSEGSCAAAYKYERS